MILNLWCSVPYRTYSMMKCSHFLLDVLAFAQPALSIRSRQFRNFPTKKNCQHQSFQQVTQNDICLCLSDKAHSNYHVSKGGSQVMLL